MQSSKGYLDARGILPETIQTHWLEIDGGPTEERIVARLGDDIVVAGQPLSRYAKELLWVPYRNADGAITSWTARIFPTPADPHPKFLAPKGGGGPPYIPPAVWAISDNATVPVILTEGPIKALACLQAEFPAIGLNGVFGAGARDAEDKLVLHPLLSGFSWAKRFVLLAFDADIATKFEVRRALLRTYLLFAAQQADVFTITSWDAEEAKGIDDFLARSENPPAELELLIKDATPFVSILEKTPADLRLVEEELKAIPLPRLQRTQIVRQMAKAVGITYKDLLESITPSTPDPSVDRELNLVDETSPWDGPVDGEELITDARKLIGKAIWILGAARMTIAFWLIAAFAFKIFRKFPYLRIKSPDRNCGKSTLVDLLGEIVFNPVIAADISPAAMYRMTEDFQPTVLLDEFDNPEQIRELTQLLNAGYDVNRFAVRFNTDKGKNERFRTYCPKIIASIKRLPETTESRSLPIDMQRVPADAEDKLTEFCDIDPSEFLTLKRKILAWVEDHLEEIKKAHPTRPAWLKTRDWDLWRPLFVIAQTIGGNAPLWVETAASGLFADRVVEQSLAIEILAHVRELGKQPSLILMVERDGKVEPFIPSQRVIDFCNGQEEASWANWKSGDKTGLTIERLAKELRTHFKIRSDRITRQNEKSRHTEWFRGYWLKDFKKLFKSYLPPDDEPSPQDTSPQAQASADEKNTSSTPAQNTAGPGNDFVSCSNVGTSDLPGSSADLSTCQVQNQTRQVETDLTSTTSEDVARSIADFQGAEGNIFLAIDVETSAELKTRSKVSADALDPRRAELRVLSAATPNGNIIVHDFRKGPLPDFLRAAIATTPLIAHGAAFDLAVLQANGYKTSSDVFCTLTVFRLLTAGLRASNDLRAVLKRHLGLDLPKELGGSDWGGLFLTEQQLEYCRNDVRHLHRLQAALQDKLENPVDEHGDGAEGVDLVRVARLEMSLIPIVVDARLRGIKVDRSRLEQTLTHYQAREKQLTTELRADLQKPHLNLVSSEQLLHTLTRLGLDIQDTSKETLSAVVDPLAGRILQYRELAGLCQIMSSWLEALDSNNRLYPPLNPLGAATGRFTCQKPNLLAVPRNSQLRGCFIPEDPELVLVEADFSNIEMRIAAWFAREERMLDVFRNGGDIHGETAERVLHDRQARQAAKALNFGCLYGGGSERLRVTARTEFATELTPEQAKEYHAQFFSAYPNLRRWHEAARVASPQLTYGATVFGRRRWADPADTPDQRDWNRFQLATNFEVQGAGADALKIALAHLHPLFANTPTRILLPVHDAILIQAPEGEAETVADTIIQAMRQAFANTLGPEFPVAVDTTISKRWGEGK
jgi:DNA polymerase-1